MPSVKYFTDPGSRFVKHPASLNILAPWFCQIQSFEVWSSFGLSQKKNLYFCFIFFLGGGGN